MFSSADQEQCFIPRNCPRLMLHSQKRVKLERTTVGHLVQPPCSGKVNIVLMAQNCVQMELLESASTDERWTDPSVSTVSTKEPFSLYFHGS